MAGTMADVAAQPGQRRLAQHQEQEERDREQNPGLPVGVSKQGNDESEQGEERGRDAGGVHELILEVVPGEDVPKPALEADHGRGRGPAGTTASGCLLLAGAAEAAKARPCLDLLPALSTEHEFPLEFLDPPGGCGRARRHIIRALQLSSRHFDSDMMNSAYLIYSL